MARFRPAASVTLVALALAACATDDGPEPTTELTVTATDGLAFEPEAFAVPAGQEVTLTLASEPAVEHDLVVEGAGDVAVAGDDGHGDDDDAHVMGSDDLHLAHADAGASVTTTFVVDEEGTYPVYCSVPGHREAGMEATLTVVDGA